MIFEEDKATVLADRFRALPATRGCAPPLEVLHPLMMLAGTAPQHLIAEFVNHPNAPARWSILTLDFDMLTVVNGESSVADSWFLESRMWLEFGRESESQVNSRTLPLRALTGIRIANTRRWGRPHLGEAHGEWLIDLPDGAVPVPGGFSDESEAFALVVLDAFRQRTASDRTS